MSYKLYTDKQEIFECKIHLEGASLTKANSRIIVETKDLKIMFEGTIDKDGNCKVPIKKLRGLVSENDKGTMKLEVIAEDTYFNPWESEFEVGTAKKIKVEVKHPFDPVAKVADVLHKQGVGVTTIMESKKQMIPMLKEYSTKTGYKQGAKKFIKEVIKKLAKK